jgi:hypothetical protein
VQAKITEPAADVAAITMMLERTPTEDGASPDQAP